MSAPPQLAAAPQTRVMPVLPGFSGLAQGLVQGSVVMPRPPEHPAAAEPGHGVMAQHTAPVSSPAEAVCSRETPRPDPEIPALRQKNAELISQQETLSLALKNAREEVDNLKKAFTTVSQAPASPPPAGHDDVRLVTAADTDAYALGYSFFSDVSSRIRIIREQGLTVDESKVLAGINDGFAGKPRKEPDELFRAVRALNGKVRNEIDVKLTKAGDVIRKALAGSKVDEQRHGLAFVVRKKGKASFSPDEQMVFSTEEQVIGGKRIAGFEHQKVKNSPGKIPYFLSGAARLGGKGGSVDVYAVAGAVYAPGAIPKNITPDMPVKIRITFDKA